MCNRQIKIAESFACFPRGTFDARTPPSHALASFSPVPGAPGSERRCPLPLVRHGGHLLASLPQTASAASIVRVRAVSPAGVTLGFRAVVGLAKGGPDEAAPVRASTRPRPSGLPPPTPCPHGTSSSDGPAAPSSPLLTAATPSGHRAA